MFVTLKGQSFHRFISYFYFYLFFFLCVARVVPGNFTSVPRRTREWVLGSLCCPRSWRSSRGSPFPSRRERRRSPCLRDSTPLGPVLSAKSPHPRTDRVPTEETTRGVVGDRTGLPVSPVSDVSLSGNPFLSVPTRRVWSPSPDLNPSPPDSHSSPRWWGGNHWDLFTEN